MSPSASSLSASARSKLDTHLRSHVDDGVIPPFHLSAYSAHGELFSQSHGKVSDGNDLDTDTVIRIFSQTKLITSIAAVQLVERGLITLDTEVGTILPTLANPNILTGFSDDGKPILVPAKNKITLRHLLNHSSGLCLDSYSPNLQRWTKQRDVSSLTWEERFFNLPLIFEPGTSWAYSPATDYVGRVVEVLAGVQLGEYFQTNILDPLKMSSTSFNLTPALKARATFPLGFRDLATNKLSPTMPTNSPWAFFNSVPDTPQIQFGAWGLWSTFADYSQLLIHLLQIAPGSDVKPEAKPILGEVGWKSLFEGGLTPEAKAALEVNRSKKIPVPGTNWSTALLVNEVDWEGRRRAGTGAWGGMAHTHFWIDPTAKIACLAGTQLLPTDDQLVFPFMIQAEKEIYAGLE